VSTEEVLRKQRVLKKAMSKLGGDVKVNFTDYRLSAIERFVGRGDRRVAKVIARAHELDAGIDSWWVDMDTAYAAWEQAISDAGLSWSYRSQEAGEWDLGSETPIEEVRGPRGWYEIAKAEGRDRKTLLPKEGIEKAAVEKMNLLDRPFPWDHISTGIDKAWLRDDLQRALNGSPTSDCGVSDCSHCGVCNDDMGHNVIYPCPPIPAYNGHVMPASDREQRIRLTVSRTGAMSLNSHLDNARMLDRILRRAKLPISHNSGFHPHPRIVTAAALPYAATSSGELFDFFLTETMAVDEFATRLNAELPHGMRVESAQEVPVIATATAVLMDSADYLLAVYRDCGSDEHLITEWESVVQDCLGKDAVDVEKLSKGGAKSTRDLRGMVHTLRVATPYEAGPVLEHIGVADWPTEGCVLAARLSLTNQGSMSPDSLVRMLQIVTGDDRITLLHAHRSSINIVEDERYMRVAEIRKYEMLRFHAKPMRNQWSRIMLATGKLNDITYYP
jgi:radical SAM-linked protein